MERTLCSAVVCTTDVQFYPELPSASSCPKQPGTVTKAPKSTKPFFTDAESHSQTPAVRIPRYSTGLPSVPKFYVLHRPKLKPDCDVYYWSILRVLDFQSLPLALHRVESLYSAPLPRQSRETWLRVKRNFLLAAHWLHSMQSVSPDGAGGSFTTESLCVVSSSQELQGVVSFCQYLDAIRSTPFDHRDYR